MIGGAETRRSFYAVFDGHGGALCSDFLANNFHIMLAQNSKLKYAPLQALQEVCLQLSQSEV